MKKTEQHAARLMLNVCTFESSSSSQFEKKLSEALGFVENTTPGSKKLLSDPLCYDRALACAPRKEMQ